MGSLKKHILSYKRFIILSERLLKEIGWCLTALWFRGIYLFDWIIHTYLINITLFFVGIYSFLVILNFENFFFIPVGAFLLCTKIFIAIHIYKGLVAVFDDYIDDSLARDFLQIFSLLIVLQYLCVII